MTASSETHTLGWRLPDEWLPSQSIEGLLDYLDIAHAVERP